MSNKREYEFLPIFKLETREHKVRNMNFNLEIWLLKKKFQLKNPVESFYQVKMKLSCFQVQFYIIVYFQGKFPSNVSKSSFQLIFSTL